MTPNNAVIIGLTGNSGSGKSTVAKIMAEYGAYVLDADLDLYGAAVEVGFHAWLRGMVTFGGVEELVAQMRQDVKEVARVMA